MKKYAVLSSVVLSGLLFTACVDEGNGGAGTEGNAADNNTADEASGGNENEENEAAEEVELEVEEASGEAPADFSFGSATVGGLWYTLSGAMGEGISDMYPDSSVTVVEGGSISNLQGLGEEIYSIGFSNGQNVPEAVDGEAEFDEPIENISTLATMYPNAMHIMVPEDSDIETVEDLEGTRVSPGIRGYSGELAFEEILDIVDMDFDDLEHIEYTGTAEAADLMRDGHLDAFVGMLAAPVGSVQELDTTMGIRLIPLDDEIVTEMNERNPGYIEHTIDADIYDGIDEDINTVAGYTVLLANEDLIDDDVAYELTKMVVENADQWQMLSASLDEFDAEYSVENNVGPMHPGAERYYEEVGALD